MNWTHFRLGLHFQQTQTLCCPGLIGQPGFKIMTSAENIYFILTEKPKFPGHIDAGHLCYCRKTVYKKRGDASKLSVIPVDSFAQLDFSIEFTCLSKLSVERAELLCALQNDEERLKWFREEVALQTALELTVGTSVVVQKGAEELLGVIRYIGKNKKKKLNFPILGRFFGIELLDQDKGKGDNDGTYLGETFFTCEKYCGLFVPFTKVKSLEYPPPTPSVRPRSPQQQPMELHSGDRVTYFIGGEAGGGMVLKVQKHSVLISTDTDKNGKTDPVVEVPLQHVSKREVSAEPEVMDMDIPQAGADSAESYMGLGVNSMVEVTLHGNTYGIIRWMGTLGDKQDVMVGLELEEDKGTSDGTFRKKRFFMCPPKRALFVKLSSCRPDSRFQSPSVNHCNKVKVEDEEPEIDHRTGRPETVPPVSTEKVDSVLIGKMKGIQGHHNSCYMDAALFSLFSCSSVLDSMLYKSTSPQDTFIQKILLCDIVNPLRSKGFVESRHVMRLRQQLQKHGYSHSFTTDEKDPEEFLIVIMHQILALDPLLKLSARGKVVESYCYQVFLDQKHSLVLPTVQQLLEHSLHSEGLTMAEVPSCLILQMPRFGKKFKMFDKIIPSLELDVTDLAEGPQQCIFCGDLATFRCQGCFQDPAFNQCGFKVFCQTCSDKVHSHPQRRSHQPVALDIPKDFLPHVFTHTPTRDKLELFAVLCIETSHYVSFIKYGPNTEDWIFFDSMADREGGSDGFNIPMVQPCPEVGMYLEMPPGELAKQVPRDMKGVAKRLFCDAYMYLYQSPRMCLYR